MAWSDEDDLDLLWFHDAERRWFNPQTEHDRRGYTCLSEERGGCVVAEGGSTMQEADLYGRPSRMPINVVPARVQVKRKVITNYLQALVLARNWTLDEIGQSTSKYEKFTSMSMGNADSYAQAVGMTSNDATCSAQGQHTDDGAIQEERKSHTDGKSEQNYIRSMKPAVLSHRSMFAALQGKAQASDSPARESSVSGVMSEAALQRSESAISVPLKFLEGGFAEVYEGTWLGCTFVMKVFSTRSTTQRLQQEWDILTKLRHPSIVQMVGNSFDSEQPCFLVMELMPDCLGELVEAQMLRRSKLSDVSDILLQIGRGMAILDSNGVMHRDLKPGNVLVKLRDFSVKVADFSLMKVADFGLCKLRGVYKGAGTGLYRAPEILPVKTADLSKKTDPISHKHSVVGLVGMGGIGKTTMCKSLCKSLCNERAGKEHFCDEDLKENGDVKRWKMVLMVLKALKAFEALRRSKPRGVCRNGGSGSAAIVAQPSKALTSPNLSQQYWKVMFSAPQMPESVFGVKLCILNDDESARKRIRTRNWSDDEIRAMLELTEEALRVDVGPVWDYVSENLWEQYGFDRASNSCENLWGTLLKSYKAIRDYEFQNRASTEFDLECREKIERITTAKPFEGTRRIQMDSGLPSSPLPLCQFQSSASDMGHFGSTDCDDVLYDELTDSEIEEIDSHSEDEGLSGDSTATLESQAEVTADSHVTRTKQSHEPCSETNSTYAGRKRSAATVDEHDLISRIAPFVNKRIEDALKPLISLLRNREEDEQNHRDKMLAIEEEKLALKREKMLFTHRVLANSNSLRASLPQVHHQLKFGKGFV